MIGRDYRARRESCGLTRERLAALAGVSVSSVLRLESSITRWPHTTTVLAVERVLRRVERADAKLRNEHPEECK